jgi:uncharacterized SAM-binding protein YcdF (DUF218 family)
MPGGDVKALDGEGERLRRTWSLRRVACFALACLAIALAALGAGFVFFVERLPTGEPSVSGDADGIVVLTGRASRISDAIDHGNRLLITGVYPTTTAAAIARLAPDHQKWIDCCVDLDHSAVNTIGNAVQTRAWTKKHGIKSLIIVTSNYHMPRAMLELEHQLPEVSLIAYPIPPERIRIDAWWSSFATTRLLFIEYVKYLRAYVRTRTSYVLGKTGRL